MEIRNGKIGTSKSSSTKVINLGFPVELLNELNTYKPYTQTYKLWSKEHINFLIYARKQKYGTRTIAKILGKSRGAIEDKIKRLERDGLL